MNHSSVTHRTARAVPLQFRYDVGSGYAVSFVLITFIFTRFLSLSKYHWLDLELGLDSMTVQMQLARIIISEISDNQVIYLQEVDGDRRFPILIGIFEATSIDRRVKEDYKPSRPLTHDLVVAVAEQLGAEFDSVMINELRDSTYFAKLRLRKEGEIIEIDARPSDAIAIAVTCSPRLPIYVSEEVLDEAAS